MTKEERQKLDKYLRGIVSALPDSPGCYQYLNEAGTIIYVGKAKNLKNRVSSYFNNPTQTYKTSLLVPKIRDIRYIVVRTEEDALLLENNLIKRYKPHYNVLLKDDKTPSPSATNICHASFQRATARYAVLSTSAPIVMCPQCTRYFHYAATSTSHDLAAQP